jgi:hypothetical protein
MKDFKNSTFWNFGALKKILVELNEKKNLDKVR